MIVSDTYFIFRNNLSPSQAHTFLHNNNVRKNSIAAYNAGIFSKLLGDLFFSLRNSLNVENIGT